MVQSRDVLLDQVRARAEWTDETIHEGILLDREDHVISAIRSNLFLVFGERRSDDVVVYPDKQVRSDSVFHVHYYFGM